MDYKGNTNNIHPIISVIVPVYNVEAYVLNTLESIAGQSLRNIEIILVDDGSEDESYQICMEMSAEDDRVDVLQIDHKGVAAARNAGLAIAKGEYISFIDADDWMDPDMLEYLYRNLESSNADIATCEFVKEYPDGGKKIEGSHSSYRIQGKQIIDEINYNGEFSPYLFNKLFRKSLLSGIRFHEGVSLGEDYSFVMEVMMRNPAIVRGGECKYHYLQRPSSVSYQGYCSQEDACRNRENYKRTCILLGEYDAELEKSALAYYILQEMAVVISMVKSGSFNKMIMKSVQKEVRENLRRYIRIRRVPLYLKICAILLSVHEQLLIVPYKVLFHKRRSVS